jgi:hypothetical protein
MPLSTKPICVCLSDESMWHSSEQTCQLWGKTASHLPTDGAFAEMYAQTLVIRARRPPEAGDPDQLPGWIFWPWMSRLFLKFVKSSWVSIPRILCKHFMVQGIVGKTFWDVQAVKRYETKEVYKCRPTKGF